MKISVVTPSFRNSKWLKLCIASVADQEGVSFEHIVQDSCSDDGTQEWLPKDTRVRAFIEKDQGMYDAVNRGYKKAQGDILCYLNCDEQFLPGALKTVADYFEAHPEVDVLLTETVVTNPDGEYICHRPSLVPYPSHIWHRFAVLTCSLFLRRKVVADMGIWFDTKWRDLGDIVWVKELMDRGVRIEVLRRFTSVFSETGDNMNLKPNAIREKAVFAGMMPASAKRLKHLFTLHHKMRLLMSGTYFRKPFDYSLYTFESPDKRVTRHVAKPTALWRGRLKWLKAPAPKGAPAQ